ncbi:argonaute PAZ domain-containing protein, partial [Synechococcus sp. B60.1]|uniref:argonaute PAZ domain-containing protein n=1 Tax=Synechococcus sp. B60.1 TaxID=2964522 RepID=UPI0039C0E2B9
MKLLQQEVTVTLNRFLVKKLTQTDLTFYEYNCRPNPLPELEDVHKTLSRICNRLEVIAVRLGNSIITQKKVPISKLKTEKWELEECGLRVLTCANPQERSALESFERKRIESHLRYTKNTVELIGGGLLWWVTAQKGVELSGEGWEIHEARRIDVAVEPDGKLYLEVDIHYRFYTPWTLHEWLENYPDIPIKWVRNRYGKRETWEYLGIFSNQSPWEIQLPELNMSLAEYHLQKYNAPREEVESSWVVEVASKQKRLPHLSRRLSPVLTLEMLASLEDNRGKVSADVINRIRKSLEERLQESGKTASLIIKEVYKLSCEKIEPLKAKGYILAKPKLLGSEKLLGSGRKQVQNPAGVRYHGCAKVGETKFGCLNLYDNRQE